ncbi:hypothetical protein B0H16DRAFT_1459564 [Mycena metata]|uniref:Uncharacterized protein n=1 Tax=Mycena metata TaxID=1033252 RepID=A0AAD7IYK1_9AGAR|nr:hypothetical protein B0H16DRAFT_1459564 [Mycena metata]
MGGAAPAAVNGRGRRYRPEADGGDVGETRMGTEHGQRLLRSDGSERDSEFGRGINWSEAGGGGPAAVAGRAEGSVEGTDGTRRTRVGRDMEGGSKRAQRGVGGPGGTDRRGGRDRGRGSVGRKGSLCAKVEAVGGAARSYMQIGILRAKRRREFEGVTSRSVREFARTCTSILRNVHYKPEEQGINYTRKTRTLSISREGSTDHGSGTVLHDLWSVVEPVKTGTPQSWGSLVNAGRSARRHYAEPTESTSIGNSAQLHGMAPDVLIKERLRNTKTKRYPQPTRDNSEAAGSYESEK